MESKTFAAKYATLKASEIDEDEVYASIGAYDPKAFEAYREFRRSVIESIALKYYSDEECRIFMQREIEAIESKRSNERWANRIAQAERETWALANP